MEGAADRRSRVHYGHVCVLQSCGRRLRHFPAGLPRDECIDQVIPAKACSPAKRDASVRAAVIAGLLMSLILAISMFPGSGPTIDTDESTGDQVSTHRPAADEQSRCLCISTALGSVAVKINLCASSRLWRHSNEVGVAGWSIVLLV